MKKLPDKIYEDIAEKVFGDQDSSQWIASKSFREVIDLAHEYGSTEINGKKRFVLVEPDDILVMNVDVPDAKDAETLSSGLRSIGVRAIIVDGKTSLATLSKEDRKRLVFQWLEKDGEDILPDNWAGRAIS